MSPTDPCRTALAFKEGCFVFFRLCNERGLRVFSLLIGTGDMRKRSWNFESFWRCGMSVHDGSGNWWFDPSVAFTGRTNAS